MDSATTPDTLSYLYLGLVVLVVIMGCFLASLVVRYRNVQKDLELVEKLSENPQ
jgi:ABC-type polysaccharide/polyol phosphate export permease